MENLYHVAQNGDNMTTSDLIQVEMTTLLTKPRLKAWLCSRQDRRPVTVAEVIPLRGRNFGRNGDIVYDGTLAVQKVHNSNEAMML
ncbi:hypothetical protein [Ferrimonas marina]|uniref:Uncharacterized protein n=1 Tax=Ferrimonas marina TaxID=299255 RepID=A0A1M5UGM6_9GAMM|nr:hypothetical protein [Ferrimonas marina]SHH62139.1 hypothetical protein SAMN02745129_2563 [Ferrimonas marina]